MDPPRLLPASLEEIPEDLRCKRSDGKQWRCSALSMPDKTVCEKHYIQAKKRAANSALRASMKKARRGSLDDTDVYLESKHNDHEVKRSLPPMNVFGLEYKKHKEKLGRSQGMYTPETMGSKGSSIGGGGSLIYNEGQREDENRFGLAYNSSYFSKEVKNPSGGGYGDSCGRSSESGEAQGRTCHQCRRSDRGDVVWCMSCDRKGYCGNCIYQWYADIPVEDIQKICPACRGICNCKVCLRGDNLIKTMVQEIASLDQLRYLHSLLSFVLPALKQIYSEQCFEIAVETRVHGMKTDIPRANVCADEQMCCNLCRIPIFDFHRHCTHCSYDLCLTCCRDIRKPSLIALKGEFTGENIFADKLILQAEDENAINFSHLFPKWKANSDGSIPCPPEEVGGCGSSKLVLRRILKINWVAKLVKNAEEMVSGCKVSDLQDDSSESKLHQCSKRDGSSDNFLYYPTSEDLKHEGIRYFHKHWVKGEPVIIRSVFDHSLASSWDPISIWRGIQETADERLPENNTVVKVTDLLKQAEVDIELTQFIKGYSEGLKHEDGWPKMLVLKDWPHPNSLEEFILCQRPEFLTNLPLVEFIHSKWGLLNLAAKLPHDTMQNEAGPKIYISYGTHDELGRGDPVSNLYINMGDVVYLLMHSAEAYTQISKMSEFENTGRNSEESNGTEVNSVSKKSFHAGAIWDVFRRQDVPKLNEFLRVHWEDFTTGTRKPVAHPVYEQSVYLDKHQKKNLKEECSIEPWTFEQHVGEAVFIPAGCPFQVRNLQSTVQLGLDFLSPESVRESAKMAQEIRCLPEDHDAKLKMWEVGKMSLYAASSAIKDIQKIVLDPKLSSEVKFEDQNLTAMVSENLQRMTKQKRIACT